MGIDANDILFELFLPGILEQNAPALQAFTGVIGLISGDRSWTITGGPGPWLARGLQSPTVRVTIVPRVVTAVVKGEAVDLPAALASGEIVAEGDVESLDAFGLSLQQVETLFAKA